MHQLDATAGNACQPALAYYDKSPIRIRPLAVQNVGTEDAFITCAFQIDVTGNVQSLKVSIFNATDVPKNVQCTGISGVDFPGYLTKIAVMPPNGTQTLTWGTGDFPEPNAEIHTFGMSCLLKSGTGIGLTRLTISTP